MKSHHLVFVIIVYFIGCEGGTNVTPDNADSKTFSSNVDESVYAENIEKVFANPQNRDFANGESYHIGSSYIQIGARYIDFLYTEVLYYETNDNGYEVMLFANDQGYFDNINYLETGKYLYVYTYYYDANEVYSGVFYSEYPYEFSARLENGININGSSFDVIFKGVEARVYIQSEDEYYEIGYSTISGKMSASY